MASFKNDFGLNGKLGDVIIYQIGNKSYARRTFRANNPKTMKQQEVRARFLVAIRFYQKLKETSLRRILKVSAQGNSFNGYTFYLEKKYEGVLCGWAYRRFLSTSVFRGKEATSVSFKRED